MIYYCPLCESEPAELAIPRVCGDCQSQFQEFQLDPRSAEFLNWALCGTTTAGEMAERLAELEPETPLVLMVVGPPGAPPMFSPVLAVKELAKAAGLEPDAALICSLLPPLERPTDEPPADQPQLPSGQNLTD